MDETITMTAPTDPDAVHQAHCCAYHGCRYGDEDCAVANLEKKALYDCMDCDEECTNEASRERGEALAARRIKELETLLSQRDARIDELLSERDEILNERDELRQQAIENPPIASKPKKSESRDDFYNSPRRKF